MSAMPIITGKLPDQNKMAVMLMLLTGKAITWVSAIWEKGGEPISNFDYFLSMFKKVFDHTPEERDGGDRLMSLSKHVV